MSSSKKLSIIIPCYNEEEVLSLLFKKMQLISDTLTQKKLCSSLEFIFIDDGSEDKTFEILKQESKEDLNIKVIKFSKNYGHQTALLAGYKASTGGIIVSLDADLQDPPELIFQMIEKINNGSDIVYGVRRSREKDTFFKRKSAFYFYSIMKYLGINIIPDHADYRMLSRKVLNSFLKFDEKYLFIRAIFTSIGFPSTTVYYDRPERAAGITKYSLYKMILFSIDGITSFSLVPLRACIVVGFMFSILSVLLLFWAIFIKLSGYAIQGWVSTVAPLYLLGGVQMIFLGIVGEYIGRIYMEVKKRPRYLIEETINTEYSPDFK